MAFMELANGMQCLATLERAFRHTSLYSRQKPGGSRANRYATRFERRQQKQSYYDTCGRGRGRGRGHDPANNTNNKCWKHPWGNHKWADCSLNHTNNNKCWKHPWGNHKWADCSLNPRSANFRNPRIQLPPRQAIFQPLYGVAVDLIGPWTIRLTNGPDFTFLALTIVDTCTTLSEAIVLDNKTAAHVAQCMELSWLHRYPRPVKVIYDRGSEFIGLEFQRMLQLWGIQPAPISAKNPQANAVCE